MYYTVTSLPPFPRITRYQHNLILYEVFPLPCQSVLLPIERGIIELSENNPIAARLSTHGLIHF